jgi:23S rRNA pseudouridine1911/1915/1917 synthase
MDTMTDSLPPADGQPRWNSGWVYPDRISISVAGQKALDFYVEHYAHSDRSVWLERFEQGQIQLDGNVCEAGTLLTAGAGLSYHRPAWQEPAAPRDFRLLYEDDDLVAVDKPSGLQVLPAAQFLENTLLDVVRERLGADLAPVHRLGRGTSGLVMFARSARARRSLSMALSAGQMKKTYRALVQGVDLAEQFTIEQGIGPVDYPGIGYVHAALDDGKPSCSHVRVVESRPDAGETLVEVEIPTGRPHQIRIHLAVAGYPLVGEPLYRSGGRPAQDTPAVGAVPLPGDMGYHLHSMRVSFRHPSAQVDDDAGDTEDAIGRSATVGDPPSTDEDRLSADEDRPDMCEERDGWMTVECTPPPILRPSTHGGHQTG